MNDLELMYLLEEEGYEPSFENLAILKEGIEAGKYEILDEARSGISNPQKLTALGPRSFEHADAIGHKVSRDLNNQFKTPNGKAMNYSEFDSRRDAFDIGREAAKHPKGSKEQKQLIKKGKTAKKLAKKYNKGDSLTQSLNNN